MENSQIFRMRQLYPKEFHCLVKMHLSFLLDLHTDDCDCSFVYDSLALATPSSKHRDLKKLFHTPRKTPAGTAIGKGVMEGLPLTMEGVCQVYQLISYLQRNPDHLKVEGLFRKHGNLKKQQILKERLNQGIIMDLDDEEFSVHEVASVLKTFLSDLPEPLLTDACYRAHCQVAQMTDKEKQIQALQLLFLLIPDSHYQLLRDTLMLLHATAEQEPSNKMSASNLATVFATHLLAPRKLSAEVLQSNHQLYIKSVTIMIEEASTLFNVAPQHLTKDVAAHFSRIEGMSGRTKFGSVHRVQTRRQTKNQLVPDVSSPTGRLQSPVVNTIFTFVDRETTSALNDKSTTATELAKLYAHVQALPESTQKKKLIQKLNDANGIGTPGHRIKTRTQKTKNQLKNFLTPRATRSHKREVTTPNDEKKRWHANSYNVAQAVTSEHRPTTSSVSTFKRRSSVERHLPQSSIADTGEENTPTRSKTSDSSTVDFVPRKTLGFDSDGYADEEGDVAKCDVREEPIGDKQSEEEIAPVKKLPPPPVPPRVSSLVTGSAKSPLSQKIASSRNVDPAAISTPRNRKPLVLISNTKLLTPEVIQTTDVKTIDFETHQTTEDQKCSESNSKGMRSGRWDSGYLSQKSVEPSSGSSPISKEPRTTSEIVDVDEEIEKLEKEDHERSCVIQDEDDWPTPPKMCRLSSGRNDCSLSSESYSSTSPSKDDSITSADIRDEAEKILRGEMKPTDSMVEFLNGGDVSQTGTPDVYETPQPKLGRKRRSITELGGPSAIAKTSTPTGIYFETDL